MKRTALSRLALSMAAVAAAALCAPVQAQDTSGNWYIAPSLYRLYPDRDWKPDDKGWGPGIKVGRALSDHFDLQLGLSSARAKTNAESYRQTLLGADMLYLFGSPGPGLRPFLSAGLGASRDAVSGAVSESKTSPYGSAGLGLRWQFTNALALQAEWKRVHSAIKKDNAAKLGFGDNQANNQYLGLALNYTFGTAAAPAPRMAQAAPPPPAPAPTMAAAPAPAPAEVKPVAPPPPPPPPAPAPKRMEKITMQGTELFALNKAELKSPQPKLDEIATLMVQNPSITRIVVAGYTDRLGSDKLNKALSLRRAEAVKAYLVGQGVSANRIETVGKGPANPLKICNMKDRKTLVSCLEPNRRVEIEPVTVEREIK